MRIGINLLYLLPSLVGGTEVYAEGLLGGLSLVDHEDKFIVFVNQEAADWPLPQAANFTRIACLVKGSNRSRRYLFEQLCLSELLKKHKVDLIHSLGYVGPLASPCPSIVTIPDLNYIDVANSMRLAKRLTLRLFSTQAARRADHIITISDFSKKRLNQALRLPNNKITVTYLAPGAKREPGEEDHWPKLALLYRIKGPYIAAFGGGALHKNIPRLIQAFARLKDRIPHNLVLIGRLPANVDLETVSIQEGLQKRVVATNYVPASHIHPLLSHADLFVLPSLYEGFGLPVLEAQQAGVPVVCSMAGSLPEVAGEGAVFFDPYSVEDMVDMISQVARDKGLQEGLLQKGSINVQRFSWEKTARETMAVYQQVLGTKSEP
jgi:glycosyltransferase involved in cell wall biosynthesis